MAWLLLLLPLAVVVDAYAQGLFTLLTRRYVPPVAQQDVNLALHVLYPCLYLLLTGAIYVATSNLVVLLFAVAIRLALFDPVLNLVKQDAVFAVGESAKTDKLIRRIAQVVRVRPELFSLLVRVLALFSAIALLIF